MRGQNPPKPTAEARLRHHLRAVADTPLRSTILASALACGVVTGGGVSVADGQEQAIRSVPGKASARAPDERQLEERQTVAEAARRARSSDRPVEALSLRTEKSSVFVNPSGSRSAKLYGGPVRVREDGRWRPLDVGLESEGGKVRPRAATADVAFSDGDDQSLARLEGQRGSLALTWEPGPLPKPEIAGAKATYENVEPGVDIAVEARPQGFDKRVEVHRVPKRPLVLRFGLALRGLKARLTADDRLELLDRRGEPVAVADPARMWGAEVDRRSQEPLRQAQVETRLLEQGGEQAIELRPDPTFVRSVKGPVTIDPAANLTTNGDTYVSSDWPSATYGTSAELKSGSYNARNLHRSLVRFPRRVGGGAYGLRGIPKGSRVTSAAIHLYNHWSWSCQPRVTEVYRVSREWSVGSANWSNQPRVGARYGSASFAKGYSSSCPADFVGFPITALAQHWVDESVPNYGVRLQPKDEASRDVYAWRKFRSANYSSGSRAPYLVVTYEPAGS
ncbi:MAG: DNRLRE domain-containing protein [Actinomycetota bacterium]|nr:DNRLRE domain-containing protein [Actinomycetota bacterium]